MLSDLSSLRLVPRGNRPKFALAQHSRLDSIMLSFMLMRSSLYSVVSQLNSAVSENVSKDAARFLVDEYEKLVAFGHEASALRRRRSFEGLDDDDE